MNKPTAAQLAALQELRAAVRELPPDRRAVLSAELHEETTAMVEPFKRKRTRAERAATRAWLRRVYDPADPERPTIRDLVERLEAEEGLSVSVSALNTDVRALFGDARAMASRPRSVREQEPVTRPAPPARPRPPAKEPAAMPAAIAADPHLSTLTLDAIAAAYGVSKRSLLRYIADGTLRARKLGKAWHVTTADLRAWLDSLASTS